MKSSEFAYWLQGYFELREDHPPLSPEQFEKIQNHLNLVTARLKSRRVKSRSDLHARVQMILNLRKSNAFTVDDANMTKILEQEVAAEFKHVIDPSYMKTEEQKQKFLDAHNGRPTSPPRPPGNGGYSGGGYSDRTYGC